MVGMNLGPVWSFGGTGDLPQVEPAPVDQSVLMMHGSRYVTLDALRRLTTPEPMGSWHRPVPHHILVATIMDQIAEQTRALSRYVRPGENVETNVASFFNKINTNK